MFFEGASFLGGFTGTPTGKPHSFFLGGGSGVPPKQKQALRSQFLVFLPCVYAGEACFA